MTIARLQDIRRLLLSLLTIIEAELKDRGVPVQERRTINASDYQQR